jgi:serum/glucocorticoid-regulated kinase 2
LLENLLVKNRKKRLGYNGANEIMQHPFFKDIDWKELIFGERLSVTIGKDYTSSSSSYSSLVKRDTVKPSPEMSFNKTNSSLRNNYDGFTFLGDESFLMHNKTNSVRKATSESDVL